MARQCGGPWFLQIVDGKKLIRCGDDMGYDNLQDALTLALKRAKSGRYVRVYRYVHDRRVVDVTVRATEDC